MAQPIQLETLPLIEVAQKWTFATTNSKVQQMEITLNTESITQ